MKTKGVFLFISALLMAGASLAQAEPRDCKTLLTGECVGCHEKQKFCKNLGKSVQFWQGTLGQMVSNGADLSKEEKSGLTTCLSQSSEAAQGVCK